METSLLEFYRELSAKSEEIGRLKALVEVKDQTIAGLTALLGMNGIKASSTELATASSLTEQFPSVEHACSCGKAIVSTSLDPCSGATVSTPIEPATESMEKTMVEMLEKVSRKIGRPKGSKNKSDSSTSATSVEELRKSEGGTVFKDFVPLELDGTISSTSNSHAYMPPEKKNSVLTVL